MIAIRNRYPEITKACQDSSGGFCYSLDLRKTLEVPEEERLAFWENLYAQVRRVLLTRALGRH